MSTATASPAIFSAPISSVGIYKFAELRDGTWIYVTSYDAGRTKAQIDFLRKDADAAVSGSIPARALAVVAEPPPAVRAKLEACTAARLAARRAANAARDALAPGMRVEFDSKKKGEVIVGTVTRVNIKTVSLMDDTGLEWRCSPGMLRPSAVAAPAALPEHPTMARWSVGKTRYGLQGVEGRSWEQPVFYDGKRVGTLRDMGDGGSTDIDGPPAYREFADKLVADAKLWAAAVGEDPDAESYALWAEWTTTERSLGKAYKTLNQRFN